MTNGLRNFSLHRNESAGQVAALQPTFGMTAFAGPQGMSKLDPESAARRYLATALASDDLPAFTAAPVDGKKCEFRVIGTELLPLTGTRMIKFRQYYHQIPVHGSLVTVELDEDNRLLALSSAIGEPLNIDPVAKLAPAEVLELLRTRLHGSLGKPEPVPTLKYYFDPAAKRWRLVYDVADAVVQSSDGATCKVSDYLIDAHVGDLVAELPRVHSADGTEMPSAAQAMAEAVLEDPVLERRLLLRALADEEEAVDLLQRGRRIACALDAQNRKRLVDLKRKVYTYDFRYRNVGLLRRLLPGGYVLNPPEPWDPAAVSAHANVAVVASYLQEVLGRDGLDNRGGPYISTINCVFGAGSKEWRNAAWIGTQLVFGQRLIDGQLRSYAVALDVVAHEMTHGLIDSTAHLEYAGMPGALNESYADIFGILISNDGEPDIGKWNWEMGEDLKDSGVPVRDVSQPGKHNQPDHMNEFVELPADEFNDWGGVHLNSGIHNRAAFNLITSRDGEDRYLFTPRTAAAIFYVALTQYLSRTSGFADSLRALTLAAQTLLRSDPERELKLQAIQEAFASVGIES